MAKKKRRNRSGHYCKVCGKNKANEKFSGKGHNNHICKSCSKLSQVQRNEKMRINTIEKIQFSAFFISKDNQGLLKKYANDKRYTEAAEYAQMVLDDFYERMAQYDEAKKQEEEFYDDIDEFDNEFIEPDFIDEE